MFTSSLTVYLILIESPRKYKKIQIKFSFPAWCFHVYFHKYMQKSERQPQTISGVVHLKQRLIMSGQYELVLIKSLKDFIHFYVVHWLMFSNSWFTIWNKYLISLCVKNKLVSSANIIGSNMFEAFFKSFTYKRNRSGPKIEPCGTPQLIVSKLVFSFSLICRNCLKFEG